MAYLDFLATQFNKMTPAEAEAWDAEIEAKERAHAEQEKKERFEKSGAPERYFKESLETFKIINKETETAARATTAFMNSVKRGEFKTLVLIGNAGTGKTHLACSLVRECGGKYRTAPDLVEELRRAKSFSADKTEHDIISYYAKVPLLVIDEIGRGINVTDEKYMLYQIFNARYNTKKPCVLISNHRKTEFLQYIGVAAADRLIESGDIYELTGDSYRRMLRGN